MQLAKSGIGTTRPNPSVGAVIVYQHKIIGEGFTSSFGKNHAEVNAINSVKNKTLLKQATIYITLEPCSHHGKTPPCADLIVKYKIKNVVIGCKDTNSLVAGKGIERLKKGGCNVVVGVLKNKCLAHHKRFFTFQNKKRPFIILKWAQTQNSFIAPTFKDDVQPVWISNIYSQQLVHKWRSEEHAILVGTNTVVQDNPFLTVRSWFGQNPIRIVLDRTLRIPKSAYVLDASVKTIIITEKSKKNRENVLFEKIDFSNNIALQICNILFKHKIQSVIIEGGTQILQTFIEANYWDEIRVFVGKKSFKKGIKAPCFSATLFSEEKIKEDTLKIYRND